MEGRLGIAPGEEIAAAQTALEQAVSEAAQRDPWLAEHPPTIEWVGAQFAAARTDEADPVVTTLFAAAAAVTGQAPRLGGMRYGADMRLLVNQAGIPTVLFGPGDVREAHRPDESVALEELVMVTKILVVMALRFCGLAGQR